MAGGLPAPDVDVMNDPAYAPQPSKAPGSSEPDHCRICRSEGTEDEPLYHPCKCSGSIKFVHQDCLMEWLQHSQKKYCELCKTHFTFTKVYDPDMPSTLPTPVFLRQVAKHSVSNVLLWARGLLVCFIWLGCLPWSVRWMWRGWFWVSDGGWWALQPLPPAISTAPATPPPPPPESTAASGSGSLMAYLASPVSALISSATGRNANNATLQAVNATAPAANVTELRLEMGGGLFFETNPFRNLTSYPVLNNLFVDVLEGQLLTALIVFSFIVVFLVREWVVQQQPILGAEAANLPLVEDNVPEPPAPAQVAEEPEDDPVPAGQDVADEGLLERAFGPVQPENEQRAQPHRVFARPRRRRYGEQGVETGGDAGDAPPALDRPSTSHSEPSAGASTGFSFGAEPIRPLPTRENTSRSVNLRRDLEETSREVGLGPSYDFASRNSAENLFQFGGGNAESSRPSSARQRTEDGPSLRPLSQWSERSSSRGRPKEQPVALGTTPPVEPPPRQQLRFQEPIASSVEAQAEEQNAPERSSNSSWSSSGSFEMIFGSNEKGKGKEVLDDAEQEPAEDLDKGKRAIESPFEVDGDKQDSEWESDDDDDDELKTEGSRGVGPSEWSTTAQAGDTPAPSDSTPPSPPITTPGSSVRRRATELPRENGDRNLATDAAIEGNALGDRMPDDFARIIGQLDQRAQRAAEERVAAQARQQAPARRAGIWDWFGGADGDDLAQEQQAQPPDDGADQAIEEQNNIGEGIDGDIPQAIAEDDVADDLEGILELVGMRGPIGVLIQNAAVSTMLITATVAIGVAFPYVCGKTVMMVLAHPIVFFFKLPMVTVSFCAEFIVDSATMAAFSMLLVLDHTIRFFIRPLAYLWPALAKSLSSSTLTNFLKNWASDGQDRVVAKFTSLETTYATIRKYPPSAVPPISLVAKDAIKRFSGHAGYWVERIGLGGVFSSKFTPGPMKVEIARMNVTNPVAWAAESFYETFKTVNFTRAVAKTPAREVLLAQTAYDIPPMTLQRWTTWDRVAVVLLGYLTFTVAGAVYVRRRRNERRATVERLLVDFLEQCGGVMKVVLIIGIEMFLFPLYCGILLDIAMLPLFETTTLASRVQFTIDNPLTSIFVHWFIGTCYMFHFALFVSMCRKIMRSGVLYFIRDPDDPTFHPVRDVLERPVIIQLRKIAFSGLIYGILVLVCLGGVVWGVYKSTVDIFPIHWSSSEPVLEFPVDLLFYNFLVPVAVKFFKPSDGLQAMYAWWFKLCARALRLSSFMFGDRIKDEEGVHVHPTWLSWLLRRKGDPENPVLPEQPAPESQVYFKRTGQFVRAPASDSVRRTRGTNVFLPVDENNRRLDVPESEDPPNGPTGSDNSDWKMVYIPPNFRLRVGLVVFGIWVFAAITGVSVTVLPLVLGRIILCSIVPDHVQLNDIYAFSVGIYLFGAVALAITKFPVAKAHIASTLAPIVSAAKSSASRTTVLINALQSFLLRFVKISYVFAAFAIVMPTLVALMIEFYIILPIHTYFGEPSAPASGVATTTSTADLPPPSHSPLARYTSPRHPPHTVHFVQDWTLGVLYLKMLTKMLLLDTESTWARSLRGIVEPGWLNPDISLATRTFIAPAVGGMTVALTLPLGLARVAIACGAEDVVGVYRFAFPAVLTMGVLGVGVYAVVELVRAWKRKVRDEIYLRGVRVHNHGESKPPEGGRVRRVAGPQ